ncbi:hypothetical protein J2S09_003013 [Bacillus fengqiuensis]|nr:hypothetical protein [Bacillus fengqiuensis]
MPSPKWKEEKKNPSPAKPRIALLKFATYLVLFFGVVWFLAIVVRFLFTTFF